MLRYSVGAAAILTAFLPDMNLKPWQKLASSADFDCLKDPWMTSKDMVLFNKTTKCIFALSSDHGLLQYDHGNNTWKQCIISNKLPDGFYAYNSTLGAVPSNSHPIAIDPETNTIYFLNGKMSLATLKLDGKDTDKKWIIKDNVFKYDLAAQATVINTEYHLISHEKHLKYNATTNKFEMMHDLTEIDLFDVYCRQFIHIKDKVLLFGADDDEKQFIFEYNVSNNKWMKLSVNVPISLLLFGATSILYDQYVALFGGLDDEFDAQDDIWIYSIVDETFRKSKVKCPKKSAEYRAFTMNDRKTDEMITSGFVRDKWRKCDIPNHLFPPQYLIRIMHNYYLNEYIHLFDMENRCDHWKIDVFDIF